MKVLIMKTILPLLVISFLFTAPAFGRPDTHYWRFMVHFWKLQDTITTDSTRKEYQEALNNSWIGRDIEDLKLYVDQRASASLIKPSFRIGENSFTVRFTFPLDIKTLTINTVFRLMDGKIDHVVLGGEWHNYGEGSIRVILGDGSWGRTEN